MNPARHCALLPDTAATDPVAPLDQLDLEILAAMLPSHPRSFWNGARADLLGGREQSIKLAALAGSDERLLRLSLLCLPAARERRGFRAFEIAKPLLAAAMALSGKTDSWRSARIQALAPLLAAAPPSHVLEALGLAARSGRMRAFEEMLSRWPVPLAGHKESPAALSAGWTGTGGMGTAQSRGLSFSRISGQQSHASSAGDPSEPANPLFWCAAWALALNASDPEKSQRWAMAGADLLSRALRTPFEGAGWLLSNEPMREKLEAIVQQSPDIAKAWAEAKAGAILERQALLAPAPRSAGQEKLPIASNARPPRP